MTPVDCDPVVGEVVEDTRAAVEEMMKELNNMVDATPQTSPPSPPPLQDDNEGLKRMVRMATIFQSPGFQNPKPVLPVSSLDIWYVLVMTCVWRHENLKRDGSM